MVGFFLPFRDGNFQQFSLFKITYPIHRFGRRFNFDAEGVHC